MKVRLDLDEAEALAETIHSDGFKPLLSQLEILCGRIEQRVLTFDLSARGDRELALEKARAEGARMLIKDLKAWSDQAKKSERRRL